MTTIFIILIFVLAIILWRLYHKIFNVVYFGMSAFFKEIIICFLIAYVIVYWLLGSFL